MDLHLSTEKQQERVNKNRRLVHYIAKKLKISNCDYDDIISEGTNGLIKAAITYDESKKITFATYASQCIRNEMLMYLRKNNRHAFNISLEEVITTDPDGCDLTLKDVIPSKERDFTEVIDGKEKFARMVSIILNCLDTRKRLIVLYWISGMTQQDIAKMLDISQSYVSRLIGKLVSTIKELFNSEPYYKEVYSIEIVEDLYKISFPSKDFTDLDKISEIFATGSKQLLDFKVVYNKEKIIVFVLAELESFSLIAKIFQEIENYKIK